MVSKAQQIAELKPSMSTQAEHSLCTSNQAVGTDIYSIDADAQRAMSVDMGIVDQVNQLESNTNIFGRIKKLFDYSVRKTGTAYFYKNKRKSWPAQGRSLPIRG